MKNRRKQWWTLYVVTILFFVALIVGVPRIPVNFNFFGNQIEGDVSGPNLDIDWGFINLKKKLDLKLGLDLQGGTYVALKGNLDEIPEENWDEAMDSARTVIEDRVNLFGVSEPNIYTAKSGEERRIIVELAGVNDTDQAIALVGQTAELDFRELKPEFKGSSDVAHSYDLENYLETDLTGAELDGATVVLDNQTQEPAIQLDFSDEGQKMFSDIAKRNAGNTVAIVLDGFIVSAPRISEDLAFGVTGSPVITGGFTTEQAELLETQLDAGALPVPVEVVEQRTIEPTLGRESISKSLLAGLIGILIVMVFMLVTYGKLGVFADVALGLYAVFSVAIFKLGVPAILLWIFTGGIGEEIFVPITLTLAGIAGFILSIGMAVDANILIFERMKEELAWGHSKKEAIRLGFDRAWSSIRDSNASTLITCIILGNFGTPAIKGFAVTLAIGVLLSLFTAVFITRTTVILFYNRSSK